MIQFIDHKNINKQKWDACIDNSSNTCIFVYSWYLDVVCMGWDALVLNDYEAVFPLATKSKYNIHYLYQPFFTRYFGVYSKNKITDKLVNDFFESIPSKYRYMEFCLHESNQLNKKNIETKERSYQVLNLNTAYSDIQNNYSDNAKRSIKKAIKAGYSIKHTIKPEQIVNLFKSTKGKELEVFKPNDYKTLTALMNIFITKNKAESLAVFDKENKLCAAAFFMKTNDRYIFLKSGVTENGKANGAMHFLFDTFIQQYAETLNMIDFGGSSVETVARFYKNFGAKDCVYLQIRKNSLPKLVKWVRSLKKQ
ncbi:MAG: hypothetical protein ACT4ON_07165 [Bacteroidota bacterium]